MNGQILAVRHQCEFFDSEWPNGPDPFWPLVPISPWLKLHYDPNFARTLILPWSLFVPGPNFTLTLFTSLNFWPFAFTLFELVVNQKRRSPAHWPFIQTGSNFDWIGYWIFGFQFKDDFDQIYQGAYHSNSKNFPSQVSIVWIYMRPGRSW